MPRKLNSHLSTGCLLIRTRVHMPAETCLHPLVSPPTQSTPPTAAGALAHQPRDHPKHMPPPARPRCTRPRSPWSAALHV